MSIFRKSSLEKLSSPEQLDSMVMVTSPSSWVAVAGGFLVVLGILVWAFFGSIPSAVTTPGVVVANPNWNFICFVPVASGKQINEGMNAIVDVDSKAVAGKVVYVEPYVTSTEFIKNTLKNEYLVGMFSQQGPTVAVGISVDASAKQGSIGSAKIVVAEHAPIQLLLPGKR